MQELIEPTPRSPSTLKDAPREQLQSSHAVLHSTKEFLKTCPSELYFIISQPSLSSIDLSTHSPHLKTAILNPAVKTRVVIEEVLGLSAAAGVELMEFVQEKCGAKVVEGRDWKGERKSGESAVALLERGPLGFESIEQREDEMRNLGMLTSLPRIYPA
jgi:hypothetical protein